MEKNEKVRVRFAPSPTGPLHIGGVRTALFNYLFAKKNKGDFLLRIEDTDQKRYVPGAEEYIIEALEWSNIHIDEGVGKGGKYGPYRQSERKEIYEKYIKQLIDNDWAYYAFDTPDELEAMREDLQAQKSASLQYDARSRIKMTNSLTLPSNEVETRIQSGNKYVVRFKMPDNEKVTFTDIVRGDISFQTSQLDDKVLFKSDGMPTYHLANVIDDHLMQITHVIRGEEWLSSTPLHVLLYKAFGWEKCMPLFAHLPLILKPNGKGKLSKRDGDRLGFPVFPLEWKDESKNETATGYREAGYFNQAFVNMLAFLGWNPGTEQEIFSMEQLIEAFSLEKVGKSGAKFDPEKAKWFNHNYLIKMDNAELSRKFQVFLKEKNIEADDTFVAHVCNLLKDRVNFVSELWEQASYFFIAPEEFDAKTVKKRWKSDVPETMANIKEYIKTIEPFESELLEKKVKQFIKDNELSMGKVMNGLRLCLVGAAKGPHLFDIMELLKKDEVCRRIAYALETLPKTKN